MRVFVAGATGAVGRRLVPQLVRAGHHVVATTRTDTKMDVLWNLGAEPVRLDALDAAAVGEAVAKAEPDAIVHQLTALTGQSDLKHFDRTFAQTNQLRTAGTDNLLAAARAAGVTRFVAQSYAGWPYAREGGPVKTEDDPLDPTPLPHTEQTNAAMRHLDEAITDAGGIALRYGGFYGLDDPAGESMVAAVRKRQFPLVGDGGGVMSFIHVHDAAAATALALEAPGPAVYNVTDDEPAPMREWLPALAAAVGAKPPFRVPTWVGRLAMGKMLTMMTEARGASNAKAKKELDWTLRYPTWRTGFPASYAR